MEKCDKIISKCESDCVINPSEEYLQCKINDLIEWVDYYEYILEQIREKKRKLKGYVPTMILRTGIN